MILLDSLSRLPRHLVQAPKLARARGSTWVWEFGLRDARGKHIATPTHGLRGRPACSGRLCTKAGAFRPRQAQGPAASNNQLGRSRNHCCRTRRQTQHFTALSCQSLHALCNGQVPQDTASTDADGSGEREFHLHSSVSNRRPPWLHSSYVCLLRRIQRPGRRGGSSAGAGAGQLPPSDAFSGFGASVTAWSSTSDMLRANCSSGSESPSL